MLDNQSMIFGQKRILFLEVSPWLCRVLMVGGSGVIVGLKCYILYEVTPAANDEWNVGMAKIEMIYVLVMNI